MKLYIKQVLDKIINELTEKQQKILIKRYGLDGGKRQGLQKIGDSMSLTRERIRQIIEAILKKIAKNTNKDFLDLQKELKKIFARYGYILLEDDINIQIRGNKKKDSIEDKYTHLLLNIISIFYFNKQNKNIKNHWVSDLERTSALTKVFDHLHKKLKKDEDKLYSKNEIENLLVDSFMVIQPKLKDKGKKYKGMWLSLSNKILMNPYGEWGSIDQPEIRLKNLNSYIGLVLRHTKDPLHFRDISDRIAKLKGSKVLADACHNELVRSNKFVTVGRGLYSLKSDSCRHGTTQEITKCILLENKNQKLKQDEIIKLVQKERKVMNNTIIRALKDKKVFKMNSDSSYSVV